ncbi:MAG TPA: hypothetical protein VGF93_23105, partial [Solirubrobacteraceae bacterium]
CNSPGNCSAVGTYLDNVNNEQGLLLTERGGSWTPSEASMPAGSVGLPLLTAVSCSSPGDCTAVGTFLDASGDDQGLLLTETNGTWGPGVQASLPGDAAPDLSGNGVTLSAVSCAAPGACTAVGAYPDGSGDQHGLLLTETGGTWSQGVEATPLGVQVSVNSVSCASPGNCIAVGNDTPDFGDLSEGLLLTETDGSWAAGVVAPAPAGGSSENVSSVSCATAASCSAVGTYFDSSANEQALALSDTSGSWTPTEVSQPADSAADDPAVAFASVSCASAGNCAAVGTYVDDDSNQHGLLVDETGGSWGPGSEASMPAGATPSADPNSVFLGSVSCASAGNCSAVGAYSDALGNEQGWLLTESSGVWGPGVEATPPSDSAAAFVNSVSCGSAGNCTAVGGDEDLDTGDTEAMLLTESGGAWTTGTQASLPANAGTGDGGGPTGPSGPTSGGTSSATLSMGRAKIKGTTAKVRVTCHGSAGQRCMGKLTLTVVETLKHGKVTSIAALASKSPKTRRKTVTLASVKVALAPGRSRTFSVSLDRLGRALLSKRHSLKVHLALLEAGKTRGHETITFKLRAKHNSQHGVQTPLSRPRAAT